MIEADDTDRRIVALTTGGEWTIQEIPLKCLSCSLHYTVWSENPDWVEENKGGYCPECGAWNGHKLFWQRSLKGFIFQHHQNGEYEGKGMLPAPTPAFGAALHPTSDFAEFDTEDGLD
jgi:hypothetical protein